MQNNRVGNVGNAENVAENVENAVSIGDGAVKNPRGKSILGVIYGVLLWTDVNAATPLGARGRSALSLALFLKMVND